MASFPPPARLLPHAGSAVLLDAILANSDKHAVAAAAITAAHPYFVAGHGVPAWVGMEMMAQVIAAHAALDADSAGHATPRRGMLLGTRHYDGRVAWFAEGMQLAIHAARTFGHGGGVGACACRIEAAGTLLAQATIVILEQAET